jgi:plastocyanin
MNVRSIVSIAALSLVTTAFLTGCPSDGGKGDSGKSGAGKTPTAKPAGSTKPASTGTGAAAGGGAAKFGKGVIKGTVTFTGEAPEMKVPKKRGEAEFCKDTEVKYNAVVVADGKLKDVFVAIADEQLKGEYEAEGSANVNQTACMYEPRVQGVLTEQDLLIKNSDPTLHNVNAGSGANTLFNTAQPKGAPDLKKSFEETGIFRLKCDVHSWMRAFVIATDNPFNAVSGDDGAFSIAKVPDGKYKLVAWHSQFGKKEKEAEVKGGEITVDFEFDGTEDEPAENKGELKDLF